MAIPAVHVVDVPLDGANDVSRAHRREDVEGVLGARQFGVDDRSGLTGPPCQPLEPRSLRRSTTARAAAWSRLLSLICCLPSPATTLEADTRATVEAASADVVRRVIVRTPFRRQRETERELSALIEVEKVFL